MFRYIKKLVWSEAPASSAPPRFESPGVLYLIPNPENNYLKRCVFQQAYVSIEEDILLVANLMHDSEQGTLSEVRFVIAPEMDMCLYQVVDDGEVLHGFKFFSTEEQPVLPEASVTAIEFDDQDTATAFQTAIAYVLHYKTDPSHPYSNSAASKYVQYEGLQRPEESQKRSSHERAELVKTIADVAPVPNPQPSEPSLYPQFADSDDEDYPDIPQESQEKAKRLEFSRVAIQELSHIYSLQHILYMSPAHLYEYDLKKSQYTLMAINLAFVLVRPQPQVYSLELVQSGRLMMKTAIGRDFAFEIEQAQNRFRWRTQGRLWEAVLADDASRLPPLIARALVEVEYEAELEEVFPDLSDQQYVLGSADDSQMSSIVSNPSPPVEESKASEAHWESGQSIGFLEGEKITDSAQGYAGSVIFATRQNRVDVMRVEGEGFRTVDRGVGPLFSRNKESVEATRILVHQQDRKGLLYGTTKPDTIYCADIERGTVVDEYKLPSAVTQVSTVFKFAEGTPEGNVLALCPSGLFELDPRLSAPSKIAREKTYKTAMDFSAITPTVDGGFAVGNAKGEIRLFKEPGQIARTQLPGLGKKLISLDVTADGEWVLGTAKSCLMLLPVLSHGKNGFIARLGSDKRPITAFNITLEDQSALGLKELNYTPARFNSSQEGKETAIVTSTGNYVVTWDFEKLKKRLKTKNFKGCYTVRS